MAEFLILADLKLIVSKRLQDFYSNRGLVTVKITCIYGYFMGLLDFFAGIEQKRDLIVQKREDGSFAVGIFLRVTDKSIKNPKDAEKVEYLDSYQVNENLIKPLEVRRAEANIRLQREKSKLQPDIIRIDRYEKEVELWSKEIEKFDKKCRYAKIVFKGNDRQELIDKTRQLAENFGEAWLKGEDLRMARGLPWGKTKKYNWNL